MLTINLGLVAVQRYNRARVAHIIDRGLRHGQYPDASYKNWLHLDGSTAEHFVLEQPQSQQRPFDWQVDAPEIALERPSHLRLVQDSPETQ